MNHPYALNKDDAAMMRNRMLSTNPRMNPILSSLQTHIYPTSSASVHHKDSQQKDFLPEDPFWKEQYQRAHAFGMAGFDSLSFASNNNVDQRLLNELSAPEPSYSYPSSFSLAPQRSVPASRRVSIGGMVSSLPPPHAYSLPEAPQPSFAASRRVSLDGMTSLMSQGAPYGSRGLLQVAPPVMNMPPDVPSLASSDSSYLQLLRLTSAGAGGQLKRSLPMPDAPRLDTPSKRARVDKPQAAKKLTKANFPMTLMSAMMLYENDHPEVFRGSNPAFAWLNNGCSFIIINQDLFCKDVLEKYGLSDKNMAKYESFVRKSNRWGFARTTCAMGQCFHHQLYRKGRFDMAQTMKCKPDVAAGDRAKKSRRVSMN